MHQRDSAGTSTASGAGVRAPAGCRAFVQLATAPSAASGRGRGWIAAVQNLQAMGRPTLRAARCAAGFGSTSPAAAQRAPVARRGPTGYRADGNYRR